MSDRTVGDYFDKLMSCNVDANTAAKWIQGDVQRAINENALTIETFPITAKNLSELIQAVEKETVSYSKAKQIFRTMLADGKSAGEIIAARRSRSDHG